MPPKGKRKAATQKSNSSGSKQPKQEGQKAVSKDLHVPIDEGVEGLAGQ